MSISKSQRRPIVPRIPVICASQRSTFTKWRPVTRLPDGTVEAFQSAAFRPSLPAKWAKESFEAIPASAKWFQTPWPTFNSSYLGQFGDHMVPLEFTSPPSAPDAPSEEAVFRRAEAPFGIFLQWAEQADTNNPQRLYVAQASLNRLPGLLQDDLPTPELVLKAGNGDVYDASIWLGIAPTYTPLHRDPNPNLYLQLAGRKVIRLLHPDVGHSVFAAVQAALGKKSSSRLRGDEMMKGQEKSLLEARIWRDKTAEHGTEVVGFEATLEAGESMFIPQGQLVVPMKAAYLQSTSSLKLRFLRGSQWQ
ncbi:MAG: hypothetical protein Q9225_001010 [Loekoesia sp. 1 TL-2023]